jgi:uncharacterized protein GlcG (DUF336 family)
VGELMLEDARRIVAGALAKGRELSNKPLTVAVLDSGGHIVALERQDGSSNLRPKVALGKASGALALGVSSRKVAEMAAERPIFVASLADIAADGIVPAAGGLIMVDRNGRALGAVGVSGATSDEDEACAMAGIVAAGMTAQE